jgi:hypothetical protein
MKKKCLCIQDKIDLLTKIKWVIISVRKRIQKSQCIETGEYHMNVHLISLFEIYIERYNLTRIDRSEH